MNCRESLILALLLIDFHAKAQEEKDPTLQIVRGIIYDNKTQKPIPNVSVFEEKVPDFVYKFGVSIHLFRLQSYNDPHLLSSLLRFHNHELPMQHPFS